MDPRAFCPESMRIVGRLVEDVCHLQTSTLRSRDDFLRLSAGSGMGDRGPESCFLVAVMVSGHYWKGPGLSCVALSTLACDYFFLFPPFHLSIEPFLTLPLAPFLVATSLIVGVIESNSSVEAGRGQIAERAQKRILPSGTAGRGGRWVVGSARRIWIGVHLCGRCFG
jgi:hypothetical protein